MMFSSRSIIHIITFSLVGVFFACTKDSPSSFQKNHFMKSFGGAYEDVAIDLVKDNGNYYILGNTADENDSTKIFLAKTDEYGNKVWPENKTYSVENKNTTAAQIIKLKEQEAFAIIGSVLFDSDSLFNNTYLLIIDENGDIIQDSAFNIIDTLLASTNDVGKCIGELENGDLTITSNLLNSANQGKSIVFRVNSNFEIREPKTYDFTSSKIYKKPDNKTFFIVGENRNAPHLMHIGSEGEVTTIQKVGNFDETNYAEIKSVVQNSNGDTYFCGTKRNGPNGADDGFIAQLTNEENFTTDWFVMFGGSKNDQLNHITLNNQNELILVGSTQDTKPGIETNNIWLLKTDLAGNIIEEKIIGNSDNELGVLAFEENDGSLIIECTTSFGNNDMITLIKTNFLE